MIEIYEHLALRGFVCTGKHTYGKRMSITGYTDMHGALITLSKTKTGECWSFLSSPDNQVYSFRDLNGLLRCVDVWRDLRSLGVGVDAVMN